MMGFMVRILTLLVLPALGSVGHRRVGVHRWIVSDVYSEFRPGPVFYLIEYSFGFFDPFSVRFPRLLSGLR